MSFKRRKAEGNDDVPEKSETDNDLYKPCNVSESDDEEMNWDVNPFSALTSSCNTEKIEEERPKIPNFDNEEKLDLDYRNLNNPDYETRENENSEGENTDVRISIDDKEISNSSYEKKLGVYFDNKLNFKTHINKLCKKASQKLHALARMSNFTSCQQKKNIMNAFILSQFSYCHLIWMCHSRSLNSQIANRKKNITNAFILSQFSYCPLIWMCHSRSLNSQINKIHERALRNDNISSFEQLLKLSGATTIHHRNLQFLAIEIYKALNNLSSPLMPRVIPSKRFDIQSSNR